MADEQNLVFVILLVNVWRAIALLLRLGARVARVARRLVCTVAPPEPKNVVFRVDVRGSLG